MSDKSKAVEPIPEEFASYEAAAEFWDTHDTTDYLDDFVTVEVETQLRQRRFQVEIEEELMQVLYQQSQQQGVGVTKLVNNMLRDILESAA